MLHCCWLRGFTLLCVSFGVSMCVTPAAGNSKGFGFVSFDCFEASDAAIEGMNGQYLCNRQITASYAYKKDTKGEHRGTFYRW